MAEPQQNRPASAPSDGPQRIKVGVMPLFSTWIYQCEDGPRHLNQRLERLAHKLMQDDRNATRRTNYGGWHYAFDLFELKHEVVTEFRNQMEQHVQANVITAAYFSIQSHRVTGNGSSFMGMGMGMASRVLNVSSQDFKPRMPRRC